MDAHICGAHMLLDSAAARTMQSGCSRRMWRMITSELPIMGCAPSAGKQFEPKTSGC
jgi:hypothetical protein